MKIKTRDNLPKRIFKMLKIGHKTGWLYNPAFIVKNFKVILKRILPQIFFGGKALNIPVNPVVGVTNKCNYKCLFCFEHTPLSFRENSVVFAQRKHLDGQIGMDIFKNIVDDLIDLGAKDVFIGGIGEPFCHPDIIEMCRYVKKNNIFLGVTTNCALLTESKIIELLDIGLDQLIVSLNATRQETYKKMHCIENGQILNDILKTLKFLSVYKEQRRYSGFELRITNVITSLNYREVVDMTKLAIELKAHILGFHRMYFCERFRDVMRYLILDQEQISELAGLLIEAQVLAIKNGLVTNIPSHLKKQMTDGMMEKDMSFRIESEHLNCVVILGDGVVFAHDCPEILGNVNEGSLIKIWFSDKYKMLRRKSHMVSKGDKLFKCQPFYRCCDDPLYIQHDPYNGIISRE